MHPVLQSQTKLPQLLSINSNQESLGNLSQVSQLPTDVTATAENVGEKVEETSENILPINNKFLLLLSRFTTWRLRSSMARRKISTLFTSFGLLRRVSRFHSEPVTEGAQQPFLALFIGLNFFFASSSKEFLASRFVYSASWDEASFNK